MITKTPFKAALINIFYINNGYVKAVSCSNEPTENDHPALQFPSALLVSFSSVFWCFGSATPLFWFIFAAFNNSCLAAAASNGKTFCPAPNGRQTKLASS